MVDGRMAGRPRFALPVAVSELRLASYWLDRKRGVWSDEAQNADSWLPKLVVRRSRATACAFGIRLEGDCVQFEVHATSQSRLVEGLADWF